MNRPSFHNILMNMALLVAKRSTCSRLQVGAVISSADFRSVLSMGYNGNATGMPNCCDKTGPDAVGGCGCIHGEANAVINCTTPRSVEKYVFVTDSPCPTCAKYLINLGGVTHVLYFREYRLKNAIFYLHDAGITVLRYAPPAEGAEDEFYDPVHEVFRKEWRNHGS